MRTLVGMLTAAIVVVASTATSAPDLSGMAFCKTIAGAQEQCHVGWKWNEEPRAHQWVQVLDPELKAWKAVAEATSQREGTSLDQVEAGKLYRVQSCEDSIATRNCVATTVFWAPLRPPVDEIPPFVVTDRGAILKISKNLPYESQASQLNMYYIRNTFESTDMSGMPPMTPPERRWDAPDFTAFDNVLNNIYDSYQGWRLPKPQPVGADVEAPPGKMPPEFIAEVPPETQKNFRAMHLHGSGIEKSMIIFEAREPKYTVTVFADVNCQHCKRMVRELDELNSLGVTVRFMAFPMAGPYSVDGRRMADIWCARNRKTAFKRAMANEPVPPASCEPDIVLHHYAIARKLGLFGSPSVLTDDGELIGGYWPPSQMLRKLTERKHVARN